MSETAIYENSSMSPRRHRNELRASPSCLQELVVASVLALACTMSGARVLGSPLPDTAGKVDELSSFLQNRRITRMEILHVDDNLETRISITPEALRRLSRSKVVIDNPWESASFKGLLGSLQEVKSAKVREIGEVRWAILFFDAAGKETSAIYLG